METRCVVISPVRNEAGYLQRTIGSMLAQTIRPVLWVIVDDGSTDGTGALADAAAAREGFIKVVHRQDRGFREAGGGVMDAFYDGYRLIGETTWQYLVKLDGDLSFAGDYFAQCFQRFGSQTRLGIGGGTVCTLVGGVPVVESKVDPAFHVRGATKIYRRECWQAIGGLIRAPGWDTVDEVKANMLGWVTYTFADLKLVHHRPTGGAYGQWNGWIKDGRANYVAGYHPLFMFLKCLRRMVEKPYLIGGCGLLVGFLGGYAKQVPQVQDKQLIRYFRRQQINRLLGKRSLWSQPAEPSSAGTRAG
jgi:glycosyltransferase involved in cell wall biosynthesis